MPHNSAPLGAWHGVQYCYQHSVMIQILNRLYRWIVTLGTKSWLKRYRPKCSYHRTPIWCNELVEHFLYIIHSTFYPHFLTAFIFSIVLEIYASYKIHKFPLLYEYKIWPTLSTVFVGTRNIWTRKWLKFPLQWGIMFFKQTKSDSTMCSTRSSFQISNFVQWEQLKLQLFFD